MSDLDNPEYENPGGIWRIDRQSVFLCSKDDGGCGCTHPIIEHRQCRAGTPVISFQAEPEAGQ